jgi:phosphoribosylglycinamide formyltransferase-1
MKRLAVLLSGRGSNFLAIHEACASKELAAEVVCVVSNKPDARGIEKARELGVPAFAFDHKLYANRAAHEAEVIATLESHAPDFVILAGYMRLLSSDFVARFRHRITNIHPSLLPSFPGVDAQKQAVEYGVKVAGCTVHLVDESLDGGPILVQRAVPVLDGDTPDELAARILGQEHGAYVEALRKLCGGYRVEGRRVIFD